ncbi:MAG: TIGR04282 family arsenosugar biosynthesis glycosyltransferase [Dehalococcoidia bacterium]
MGAIAGTAVGVAVLAAAALWLTRGNVQPLKALIAVWLAALPVLGVGALLGRLGAMAAPVRPHRARQPPGTVDERMNRRSAEALVFMVKWPEPGRAKTRLCPPLSFADAAELARAFLLDTLTEAAKTDADLLLAYAPEGAGDAFRSLVGSRAGLIEADADDLGGALSRAQAAALDLGYQRVALVAADVPHLDTARYSEAFAALDGADAVIGPSSDGGYYLLATARRTPELFEGIAWSTDAVYGQTLAAAEEAGLRIATVASCDDVDTAADLVWLLEELRRRPSAGHTLTVLDRVAGAVTGAAAD